MGRRISCRSSSVEETRAIAAALASALRPGDVVTLSGDLGAGKTSFVQGAAAALGVAERVTSPTFILMREYQGAFPILHLDVYRMSNLQELTDLGYEEFMNPSSIVFIEWGDAIGPLLPDEFLDVELRGYSDEERSLDLHAHGREWNERLAAVREAFAEWSAH